MLSDDKFRFLEGCWSTLCFAHTRSSSTDVAMNRHRRFLCTLLALLPFIAGGVAACSSSSVTSGPTTSAKCQVTVGALGPVVASGGTASVPVTAPQECGWDATTLATWITGLEPSSGQGTAMLEIQVAPNPAPIARETDVLINQERVHVSQDAAPCVYTIAPNYQTVPAAGGPGTIDVTTLTGCSWNGVAGEPWITITGADSGSGNGTLRFSAAANGGAQRDGTVTIAGQVSTISQPAQVTPAPSPSPSPSPNPSPTPNPNPSPSPSPGPAPSPTPPPCTYAISPTTHAANGGVGAGPTVSVSAANGCTWTATSNVSWLTITSGAIGNGNGSVTFTVASNPFNARSGSLTIAGHTLSVQQAACAYVVTPTTYAASPGGGAGPTVTVSSENGCTWTAASNDSWISITSGTSGIGNGSVAFSVALNPFNVRSGSLTIAGQTFSVQQATSCVFTLSRTTVSVPSDPRPGVTRSLKVTTSGPQCNWTASTSNSWITIVSGSNYVGTQDVDISATPNPGDALRRGELLVAGQRVIVEQQP
jgi:Putative binding domain, N-terminal